MTPTLPHPNSAKLRKNLDAYTIAVGRGEEFRLYRYQTPIGIISAPAVLSQTDRTEAVKLSFSGARDSLAEVRKLVMDGKTVVVTKERRRAPSPTSKGIGRGRSGKIVVDDVLAIRPLPEARFLENLSEENQENRKAIERMDQRFRDFMKTFEVFAKAKIVKALDEEIAELNAEELRLRGIVDNLKGTARRNGVVT